MTNKLFNRLLLFALFGIAMFFFGNLYEAIVIGPNMLADTPQRMAHFQNFFIATNPAFFYIPVPQLATVVLPLLYFKTPTQNPELKKLLKLASAFQIAAIILSVYIITQINLKLFFGDLGKYTQQLSTMALTWNFLNIIRLFITSCTLTLTFKAYLLVQKIA
jgi:hypothetical protein